MSCSDFDAIVQATTPTITPVYSTCGDWVTMCGYGKQEIRFHLGQSPGMVYVWYELESTDDTVYVLQDGDIVGAISSTDNLNGTFSFMYYPIDGSDEVTLVFVGSTLTSSVKLRLDCPVDVCTQYTYNPVLSIGTIDCGTTHTQEGFMLRQNINLGSYSGSVTLTFSVDGSGHMLVMQGTTTLYEMMPNREGTFTFDYDPAKGQVYVITNGIADVKYRFSCPETSTETTLLEEKTVTCGSTTNTYDGPQQLNLDLGTTDGDTTFTVEVPSTISMVFYQGSTVIASISGYIGTETIDFSYAQASGDVYVVVTGTGNFSVKVPCPAVPTQKYYNISCGGTDYVTYAGLSKIDVGIFEDGNATLDLIITGTTTVTVTNKSIQVFNKTGSYTIPCDSSKNLMIVSQGDSFQARITCPVTPVTEATLKCGNTGTFTGPALIDIDYGTSSSGTSVVNSSRTVQLYKNDILQASGKQISYDYDGQAYSLKYSDIGTVVTLSATCPITIPVIACGTGFSTSIPAPSGTSFTFTPVVEADITFYVAITGTVTLTFWYKGVGFHQSTATETFTKNIDLTAGDVTVTSSGTGSYSIKTDCPVVVPTTGVANCSSTAHNFTGPMDLTLSFGTTDGAITILPSVAGTLTKNGVEIALAANTKYDDDYVSGDTFQFTYTGTSAFTIKATCPTPAYSMSCGSNAVSFAGPCLVTIAYSAVGDVSLTPNQSVPIIKDGTTVAQISANTTYTDTYTGTEVYQVSYTGTEILALTAPCPEVPIPKARWGAAMFSNVNFTGGPIASEITEEEAAYGVNADYSPTGIPYTHWTGVQDFCDSVMTHEFTLTADAAHTFTDTITIDQFLYVMWDARLGENTHIINMENGFTVTFEGIYWRNDAIGNYEGLPGYDANLPTVMPIQYDDGNGVRTWYIIRQEATTLPDNSPRSETYSMQIVES